MHSRFECYCGWRLIIVCKPSSRYAVKYPLIRHYWFSKKCRINGNVGVEGIFILDNCNNFSWCRINGIPIKEHVFHAIYYINHNITTMRLFLLKVRCNRRLNLLLLWIYFFITSNKFHYSYVGFKKAATIRDCPNMTEISDKDTDSKKPKHKKAQIKSPIVQQQHPDITSD